MGIREVLLKRENGVKVTRKNRQDTEEVQVRENVGPRQSGGNGQKIGKTRNIAKVYSTGSDRAMKEEKNQIYFVILGSISLPFESGAGSQ